MAVSYRVFAVNLQQFRLYEYKSFKFRPPSWKLAEFELTVLILIILNLILKKPTCYEFYLSLFVTLNCIRKVAALRQLRHAVFALEQKFYSSF